MDYITQENIAALFGILGITGVVGIKYIPQIRFAKKVIDEILIFVKIMKKKTKKFSRK